MEINELDYLYNICSTNPTLFAPVLNLLSRIADVRTIYIDEENFCIEDMCYNEIYIYSHQSPIRHKIIESISDRRVINVFDEPTCKEIQSLMRHPIVTYNTPIVCNHALGYDDILLNIRPAIFDDFDKLFKVAKDYMSDIELKDAIFYNKLWVCECSYAMDATNFIVLNSDNSIRLLYVDENYRNRGFGREMVKFIVDENYSKGIPYMLININRKHEDTIDYFIKQGFDKAESPIFVIVNGGYCND